MLCSSWWQVGAVGVGAADGVGAGCAGVEGCSVEVVGEGLCSDGVDCESVGSVG